MQIESITFDGVQVDCKDMGITIYEPDAQGRFIILTSDEAHAMFFAMGKLGFSLEGYTDPEISTQTQS